MADKNVDIKLYIETLGCPKNFNDSECAAGIWEQAGMSLTEDPASADAIMVNTCGFIGDAKKESIDTIFDYIRLAEDVEKGGRPRPLVCVSGCLSQRYAEELAQEMPEIDLFIGVNEYEELPKLIGERLDKAAGKENAGEDSAGEARRPLVITGCASEEFEEFSARRPGEKPYTATLRVAEGCNNRCAYCVIPYIRGGYRSRRRENIIAEAKELATLGCRELILIAQDVTEYGRDIYGKLALPQLLTELCGIDGIRWIRLMYCYEDKITDELIEGMAREEKICHYIDIPLQHVSDRVLASMRRRSTNASIRDTIGRLRKAIPDIHIRTTFITGFPGETEEEFAELSRFAEEMGFERLGVFPYSREEGTPAGDMPDQIDDEVKVMRADEIMRHQVDISRRVNEAKVGTIQEVLIEGKEGSDAPGDAAYIGRTVYDAPEIDDSVIITSDVELEPGDMIKARVIDAFDYDLVAEFEERIL